MSIAHVLAWLKFWEWPERIVKLIDQWNAMRESARRARIAKIDLEVAEAGQTTAMREIQITEMMHQIRKLLNEAKPGTVPLIEPDPGTDLDIFREAMRRLKER